MDIGAHILYGVAICSRTGWAGGRKGHPAARWYRDPTVGLSASFSLLPDAVSMGLPMLTHVLAGVDGDFFARFGGNGLVAYRYMHSLLIPTLAVALMGLWRRRWMIPALAWPLHVALDSFSHADGKFRTTLLYPFSDWGFNGIAWWTSGRFVASYWAAALLLWLGLFLWRKASAHPELPNMK